MAYSRGFSIYIIKKIFISLEIRLALVNLAKFNHFTIFSRYITGISWAKIKNWVLKARLWLPLNRLFLLVFDWIYVCLCGSYGKGVKMHWPLPTQRGYLYSLLTQYRIIRLKRRTHHVQFGTDRFGSWCQFTSHKKSVLFVTTLSKIYF